MRLTLHARAKLNLHLRIGSLRPDGYHDLETLFHAIDLEDVVEITLRAVSASPSASETAGGGAEGPPVPGRVVTHCQPDIAGPSAQNLATRAARAFLAHLPVERRPDVEIRLDKHIPAGGGLGGGSSDAAAVLVGLDHLFPGVVSRAALGGMARSLGADVPFFLGGGAALARGVGEILEPLSPWLEMAGILVIPPYRVATGSAFRALDALPREEGASLEAVKMAFEAGDLETLGEIGHNSFERVVRARYPLHDAIVAVLRSVGAVWARLTGSGSAIFGLFPGVPDDLDVDVIRRSFPDSEILTFRGADRGVRIVANPAPDGTPARP